MLRDQSRGHGGNVCGRPGAPYGAFQSAQLVGGACAILAIRALYPDVTPADAAEVVPPHEQARTDSAGLHASTT